MYSGQTDGQIDGRTRQMDKWMKGQEIYKQTDGQMEKIDKQIVKRIRHICPLSIHPTVCLHLCVCLLSIVSRLHMCLPVSLCSCVIVKILVKKCNSNMFVVVVVVILLFKCKY